MILFSTNKALHLETSAYQDNRVQPPTHDYTAHSQLPTHSMWRLSTILIGVQSVAVEVSGDGVVGT